MVPIRPCTEAVSTQEKSRVADGNQTRVETALGNMKTLAIIIQITPKYT